MRFFLISDKIDTLTGMRLAGINGVFVNDKQLLMKTLDEVTKDPTVGIILMTENLSFMIPERVQEIRMSKDMPILTVIPDRHGAKREDEYITNYIKESVGINI